MGGGSAQKVHPCAQTQGRVIKYHFSCQVWVMLERSFLGTVPDLALTLGFGGRSETQNKQK